ncbi:MAG TPA: hypothetical protein VHD57_03100 [Vicinamibacterales bacterium]|jgi:hypothetical protein|nr:hypothetical protein [Vicinamibacterales bacterium]
MTARPTSPLTATQLVDEYFIENRNRLLEIAAFLDRIDRADPSVAADDFRMRVFAEAVTALTAAAPERLAHIQMLLSDPDATPLEALDRKGAVGAYDPSLRESRS